jgi:hypothetical protein
MENELQERYLQGNKLLKSRSVKTCYRSKNKEKLLSKILASTFESEKN